MKFTPGESKGGEGLIFQLRANVARRQTAFRATFRLGTGFRMCPGILLCHWVMFKTKGFGPKRPAKESEGGSGEGSKYLGHYCCVYCSTMESTFNLRRGYHVCHEKFCCQKRVTIILLAICTTKNWSRTAGSSRGEFCQRWSMLRRKNIPSFGKIKCKQS